MLNPKHRKRVVQKEAGSPLVSGPAFNFGTLAPLVGRRVNPRRVRRVMRKNAGVFFKKGRV